ncbi:hypothetical protein XaC1_513 [Xanthomonas phage XaC1]|nr:hypothetical protein XaC1_513 [Xanthomonas phage XaC1]
MKLFFKQFFCHHDYEYYKSVSVSFLLKYSHSYYEYKCKKCDKIKNTNEKL